MANAIFRVWWKKNNENVADFTNHKDFSTMRKASEAADILMNKYGIFGTNIEISTVISENCEKTLNTEVDFDERYP